MSLTRKQIYRRRRATVFTGVAVVLALAFYLPMTLLAPLGTVSAQVLPHTIAPASVPEYDFPDYGASGVGAVGYPGLFAKSGSTHPLPMASISKVFTAFIVLDKKPLAGKGDGPMITFGPADVAIMNQYAAENGEVAPVTVGQKMSEKDVLKVMLIKSANNYAWSLANWAYGSIDNFLSHAKSWLKAHKMTSTTMVDPCGLSADNRSTPADLIELGKAAVTDPVIGPIVASQHASVPDLGDIDNTNTLLGIDGINGIKTGTLDQAGASLLFSADYVVGKTPITIIGVILDGPDHPTIDSKIRDLISVVQPGFHQVVLAAAGQKFASYSTPWGATANAVSTHASSVVVWADTAITSTVKVSPVGLATDGKKVGSVTFTAGTNRITVPLSLDTTITDPGAWWRLTNPGELF